jgi:hypothetical protein
MMLVIVVCLGSVKAQSALPMLELYDSKGEPILGQTVRSEIRPAPAVTARFRNDARLANGRVVRGIGINSSLEGSKVRVTITTLLPRDPALQFERPWYREDYFDVAPLVTFVLEVGGTRRLDEMKSLGVDPMSVRVLPPGQHAH